MWTPEHYRQQAEELAKRANPDEIYAALLQSLADGTRNRQDPVPIEDIADVTLAKVAMKID